LSKFAICTPHLNAKCTSFSYFAYLFSKIPFCVWNVQWEALTMIQHATNTTDTLWSTSWQWSQTCHFRRQHRRIQNSINVLHMELFTSYFFTSMSWTRIVDKSASILLNIITNIYINYTFIVIWFITFLLPRYMS